RHTRFSRDWSSDVCSSDLEDDEVTVVDGGALGLTTGYDETDADDGKAGENDDIRDDVENLVGGNGGDTLVGSRGSNVISGGPGRSEERRCREGVWTSVCGG